MHSRQRSVSGFWAVVFLTILLVLGSRRAALAGDQSDDNSLSSLGITTQGVTVSPDFSYDRLTYDVVVPAGTTELQLDPVLSNPDATINSIDGTTLTDGKGTVTITTTAPSGAMTAYTLNVTTAADTNVDPAQAISEQEAQKAQSETAAEPQPQPESETEDPRYVKVDKNTLQDAEDTISRLQKDLQVYKDRSHQFTYVIYVLIAACVVLLFAVVNLILRKKDISSELREYKKGHRLPEDFDDSGDVIPQGGWLDDDPDERPEKKRKKRRTKDVPQYSEPEGGSSAPSSGPMPGRVNVQTSWTSQQVGTPMEVPKTYQPYNGYAADSRTRASAGEGRQPGMQRQSTHVPDETRLYDVSALNGKGGNASVPGDETIVLPGKKLTKAGKTAKKQAAGKRMQSGAAARNAQSTGAQPQQGGKDRTVQQRADAPAARVRQAAPEKENGTSARSAQSTGAQPRQPGNDVKVDMIDL